MLSVTVHPLLTVLLTSFLTPFRTRQPPDLNSSVSFFLFLSFVRTSLGATSGKEIIVWERSRSGCPKHQEVLALFHRWRSAREHSISCDSPHFHQRLSLERLLIRPSCRFPRFAYQLISRSTDDLLISIATVLLVSGSWSLVRNFQVHLPHDVFPD